MRVGTVAFMPPEIHGATDTAYEGGPLDVWGLGCICYMMTTATFPFGFDGRRGGSSAIQVLRRIQLGAEAIEFRSSHFAPHVSLSESLIALLKAVFVVSPPERWDLDRIMGCEWVQASDGFVPPLPSGERPRRARPEAIEWPRQPRQEPSAAQFELDGMHGFDLALDAAPAFSDTGPVLQLGGGRRGSLDLGLNDDSGGLDLGGGAELQLDSDLGGGPPLQLDSEALVLDGPDPGAPLLAGAAGAGGLLSPVIEAAEEASVRSNGVESTGSASTPTRPPGQPPAQGQARTSSREIPLGSISPTPASGEGAGRAAALVPTGDAAAMEEAVPPTPREKGGDAKPPEPVAIPVPDGLECSITGELMTDPVMTSDGHTCKLWVPRANIESASLT